MTHILIFLMIGLSVTITPVLSNIPMPVLFGVFLYMGVASLKGLQFFDRMLIMFMPAKYQPDYMFLRKVIFTLFVSTKLFFHAHSFISILSYRNVINTWSYLVQLYFDWFHFSDILLLIKNMNIQCWHLQPFPSCIHPLMLCCTLIYFQLTHALYQNYPYKLSSNVVSNLNISDKIF